MDARARALGIALVLCALGCGGAPTEIVLVVGTDIPEADSFEVRARFPSGAEASSTADLGVQPSPRRLVLFYRGGELGPVELTIEARQGAAVLATARRSVTFEPDASLTLEVFLSRGCQGLDCGPDTCGNDGACRSVMVRPCEYQGRACEGPDGGADAGRRDAGREDGGGEDGGVDAGSGDAGADGGPGCTLDSVCGVLAAHLPGDRVDPVPCGASIGATVVTVTDPGGGARARGLDGYLLDVPGTYTVSIADDVCTVMRSDVTVGTATVIAAPISVMDQLRAMDARIGTAFVAGQSGLWAVERAGGWTDLRAGVTMPAPDNLRGVAVVGGVAFVGADGDEDSIWRIDATAPFMSVVHTPIGIPIGDRSMSFMAARHDDTGPLLLATKNGLVIVNDPTGSPTSMALGANYEADIFAAIGTLEHSSIGAAWGGRDDGVVNRALGAGGAMNGGLESTVPMVVDTLSDGAVDDRGGRATPRVWLCGSTSLAGYDLASSTDWTMESTFGLAPAATFGAACERVTLGSDRDLWVSLPLAGVARARESGGAPLVTLGAVHGLDAAFHADELVTVHDATTRELWLLDATRREVAVFTADRVP